MHGYYRQTVLPSRSLTVVPVSIRSCRSARLWEDALIMADHIVNDHPTIDAAPTMEVRRRTDLHRDTVVLNGEAVASETIHRSSPR